MKKHEAKTPTAAGTKTFNRRSFLGLAGISAVALSTAGVLTSCGNGAGKAQVTSSLGLAESVAKVVPSYVPMDLVTPDIASVDGSAPGFTTIPATLVKSVTEVPGKGGSYKAMTPAWWTVPPALANNSYYQSVNDALGATIDFQVNDGNSYGDKIQTVLASPKDVPDWVVIPSWNLPPRFSQAVTTIFEDLSPYLAGDKVKKYPNLANIPTAAWKFSAFADGLYGLPYPSNLITDALFYRKDIFTELGLEAPKSADEYLAIAKELTDPAKKRWGSEDAWNGAQIMFGVVPKWKLVDGALVNKVETDEYRAALEWIAKLFASGAVHPDAVAGNLQQAKSRFESGASLMATDGVGSWHESLGRMLPTNPKYDMAPMDYFAADGGEPTLYRGSPASIFSFVKKNSDKSKIEEILALANYMAAPFGTEEYQLINYGVEGVHYTRDAQNIPQATDKGRSEVTSTYAFLVNSAVVHSKVQYPGFVKAAAEWEARQAPFVKEGEFFGLQIEEPSKFGSLGKPFEDLAMDIARGRKKLSDLDAEIAKWKKNGGDELREFYAGFLSA